jgi:hypothetical protein
VAVGCFRSRPLRIIASRLELRKLAIQVIHRLTGVDFYGPVRAYSDAAHVEACRPRAPDRADDISLSECPFASGHHLYILRPSAFALLTASYPPRIG